MTLSVNTRHSTYLAGLTEAFSPPPISSSGDSTTFNGGRMSPLFWCSHVMDGTAAPPTDTRLDFT